MKLRSTLLFWALALALPAALGGCAAVSFLVASFVPGPRTPAAYELEPNQCVLVFPDDVAHPLNYPPLKRMLAEGLNDRLTELGLADRTVEYEQLRQLAHRSPAAWRAGGGEALGVAQVAEALGADVAVYLDIREFRLKDNPSDPVWKGNLKVLVKVVDASGERLWPTDQLGGHEVLVATALHTSDARHHAVKLTGILSDRMVDKVARLFYAHRHEPEPTNMLD